MADGLVNAVLVAYRDGYRWVTDASSISTWGRREGFLSVGDVADLDVVDEIGDEWLAARSQPRTTVAVTVEPTTGDVPGADFGLGDTVTVAGDSVRTAGITYTWSDADEDYAVKTPEFTTRADELLEEADRAVDRLIAVGGGPDAVSAPPVDRGTEIPTGKIRQISVPPWSWQANTDLDATGEWQQYTVEEPIRLFEWEVRCESDGTGTDSTFRFYKNGTVNNPLLNIVIDGSASGWQGEVITLYGYEVLRRGDVLSVACETNGGAITNGSIQFRAAEIV